MPYNERMSCTLYLPDRSDSSRQVQPWKSSPSCGSTSFIRLRCSPPNMPCTFHSLPPNSISACACSFHCSSSSVRARNIAVFWIELYSLCASAMCWSTIASSCSSAVMIRCWRRLCSVAVARFFAAFCASVLAFFSPSVSPQATACA